VQQQAVFAAPHSQATEIFNFTFSIFNLMKRIGILTGGGDCPGLNAVIRAVYRKAEVEGMEVIGLRDGWRGLIDNDTMPLTREDVAGILHRGGTILGSSRTNPSKIPNGLEKIRETWEAQRLEALVAVGGEDTLGVGLKLFKEGFNIVGVPKTIDNDLSGTDFTFGFDTAVNIAMEAIDRLHTTAESHHRILVLEVMGRHAGWIALYSGMAGGADVILVPEIPVDIDAVADTIISRFERGRRFSIVVASEGAKIATEQDLDADGSLIVRDLRKDSFGHVRLGGIGDVIAQELEKRTGFETRASILGYIQRGGAPTAADRVLGTRFGVAAVEMILAGKFGRMCALNGNEIVDVSLEVAVGELKRLDPMLYETAKTFFG
jgi:phosphofructokinase-like protein